MKPTFAFFTLLTGVASLAISLPLNEHEIEGRHEHFPGTSDPPSVDATSTRSQWVSAYKPRKPVDDTAGGASVDATSTRSQWVSAYKPRKPVDDTAGGASLDATSTRSQWVTSYKPKKSAHHSNHWLPTGPGYLDINDLGLGYKAHLIIMQGEKSWLQSQIMAVKRFLHGRSIF